MKRIDKNSNKTKLDSSEGIELKPLCDESITKIISKEAGLSKPFNIVNLTAPNKKHLHIRGYVDFYGGYAEHCRRVLDGLHNTGKYCLKLTPIKTPVDIDPIVWNRMNKYVHPSYFNIKESDYLCIGCPGWFKKDFLPSDRKVIGWTMIETETVQPDLINFLNNADIIWNPTQICYDRMKKSGVSTEMDIVHLGYDEKEFNQDVLPLDIPQLRGRYVFGVLGSWNCRKGIKEIIHAFCKAFDKNDQVSLFMVCKYGTRPYDETNGRLKEEKEKWCIKWEFEKYLEEIGLSKEDAPHIALLDIPVHESILPNIMANMNCLVGFSKGESTWLPGLQAMATGIPIIQLKSECSGFMDYLSDVAFLCEDSNLVMAEEEDYLGTSELYEGVKLAKGNVDELSHMIKEVYSIRKELKNSSNITNGINKAKDWTWDKSIEQINNRLLKI